MKLTASQLRSIIREEVGRYVVSEALDPKKLVGMKEEEIFSKMKEVAEATAKVADQAARATGGLRGKAGEGALTQALEVHMKSVEYSLAGLQACVDALKSKMEG